MVVDDRPHFRDDFVGQWDLRPLVVVGEHDGIATRNHVVDERRRSEAKLIEHVKSLAVKRPSPVKITLEGGDATRTSRAARTEQRSRRRCAPRQSPMPQRRCPG